MSLTQVCERTRRRAGAVLGAVSVLVVIGTTMGAVDLLPRAVPMDDGAVPSRRSSQVEYRLMGRATGASITLEEPRGSQQKGVAVPLRDPATGHEGLRFWFQQGDLVSLAAQNDRASGTLTCQILVDGRVIAQRTTADPYGIAACTGRV